MKKEIENIKERLSNVEKKVVNIEASLSRSTLIRSGKLIKCNHCGYIWRTQSKAVYVSCPKCSQKVLVRKKKIDDNLRGLSILGKQNKTKYDYLDPIFEDD